ncbi:HAD family hydrolase [Streptomyces sp. NPDC056190]|uniref:HAD family hydrolase n=1 Tax=Streptomyces sp. NPDC056190 TaxID=3345741 RepID=UPI0035DD0197
MRTEAPAFRASSDAYSAAQADRWVAVALRTITPALDPGASDDAWTWLYEGRADTRRALLRQEPCTAAIQHTDTRITWTIRPVLFLPLAHDGTLNFQRARGLRSGVWALVTSNYEHRVRGRFARTGLPVPEVLVDAAAVKEGKPSPVPYLQAAARLGAKPEDCLVIEDAPSGVQAGLRAGMTVWGVNTPAAENGVHRHFDSLREAVSDILAFASGHSLAG